MGFGERVTEAVRRAGTPLVLGIDPRADDIPPGIETAHGDGPPENAHAERVFAFSRDLVVLAAEEGLAAVKLQAAFYEATGPGALGMAALMAALKAGAEAGLLTIADVKRGDIGSTAEAYAAAYLGPDAPYPADAVTASPFLGEDSLAPLVARAAGEGRGVFVLVRTSNPGARDLQLLELKDGRLLCDAVAEIVERIAAKTADASGYGVAGAVVGATAPKDAKRLRKALPHAILLAPGVGAQGAEAAALAPFFDARGEGVLVPVSRAVSGAWRAEPGRAWQDACRDAIRRLRAEIAEVAPGNTPLSTRKKGK